MHKICIDRRHAYNMQTPAHLLFESPELASTFIDATEENQRAYKTEYDEFVNFANLLADESAQIISKYFRKKINIENKKDDSPVTIADRNTELKIRELITQKYPSHGILGEEYENTKLKSELSLIHI